MRIAILGTRGIPSQYGGFEKCAEHIALSLVKRGHEVIVYNSHNHFNQRTEWNGVKIVHIHDPEFKLSTFGRFVYDYRCIKDLKKQNCDIALQLGYRSSPIWGFTIPKNLNLVTNMGGLEWKRPKYGRILRQLIVLAEKWAVDNCHHLISDSLGIQQYLEEKFNKTSEYIPYGANIFNDPDERVLKDFHVSKYKYDLFIGNLEPENNLEMILAGVVKAKTNRDFLIVGNHLISNGKYLKNKFKKHLNIKFLGGIYDGKGLNNLRYYSNLYFHGHSLGGTNPLLLEAMACGSLISANYNKFNKYIAGDDAMYFHTADDVAAQMMGPGKESQVYNYYLDNNNFKIRNDYSWAKIGERYERYFYEIIKKEFVAHHSIVL
ncbi:DUF1972 domain-containing protein [Pedobacter fastidiosus]|uniref:DUF1972 domain-containing protein n=1 Tax=Pedobacter fastidiosus TaxID=2765361 RepID=A0ABR7KWJ9_9SPHI|nr:DUF1972 domain-containing protein [Pedobacter fastidiosus]MBC6112073.1 DUF1972 domain-containing protein [Pedobacter fastidiosus]